jgi:rubrerythrin
MVEFSTPFSGKNSERKLTRSELIRAIRISIADEYEAIQVYTQLAESIDDPLAKAVLMDIADEERVHAGEFIRLLMELAPDEAGFYADGTAEVEAMIARVSGNEAQGSTKKSSDLTIGSLKE